MTNPSDPIVHVGGTTELRSGVSHENKTADNVIATVVPGDYPASAQCTGARFDLPTATNIWWVKIMADGQTGWVTATVITDPPAGNDAEIPGVTVVATVNP